MDPTPAELLTRLGGVATLVELKELSTRDAVRQALADGSIERLHRTKAVLPGVDEARRAALRSGGQVSHLSAALGHGWKVLRPPAKPTISLPRDARAREREGIEVHWHSRGRGTPGSLTSPIDTVMDCARDLPFGAALAVADSALRARAVTRQQLLAAARESPRTGRKKAVRVAECADGRAANPFESGLRAIALGVPGFTAVAQCAVPGVGHCDVGDPGLLIAAEAESFEFHALKEAFTYDVRRYTAMVRGGWLVARFVWDDVMHRETEVAAVFADLVALRVCSSSPPAAS